MLQALHRQSAFIGTRTSRCAGSGRGQLPARSASAPRPPPSAPARITRVPTVRGQGGMLGRSARSGLVWRMEELKQLRELSADGGAASVGAAEQRWVLQHLLPSRSESKRA